MILMNFFLYAVALLKSHPSTSCLPFPQTDIPPQGVGLYVCVAMEALLLLNYFRIFKDLTKFPPRNKFQQILATQTFPSVCIATALLFYFLLSFSPRYGTRLIIEQ